MEYLNYKYPSTNPNDWIVVVLAPTGIAAYNVNGQTLHRFFKLPVGHDDEKMKYWSLRDKDIKDIRNNIKNLQLILIGKSFKNELCVKINFITFAIV